MAQITARAFGGICIDGACPAWDVSWSTDRPYQKKPLRPLPLVEDPFEHIGMESRLGQIAPRPKLGNGGAMAGQWRDVWCQGRFSIAWPRLPLVGCRDQGERCAAQKEVAEKPYEQEANCK